MRANDHGQEGLTAMPGGWLTDSPRQFRLLMEHEPPRPYGFADQLREDAREWRCVVYWLVAASFIAGAVATRLWPLALFGVWAFVRFFQLVRATVLMSRDMPIRLGTVEVLGRRSRAQGITMAQARLEGGEEVSVGMPDRLAAIGGWQGGAEVAVLYDAEQPYSLVVCIRPLPMIEQSA
jgi:hypothetical protein